VIENGVPVPDQPPAAARRTRGFALALGRICPEKGFHLALRAARKAGMPLIVAGQVFNYPSHEKYFREEMAPQLDPLRRFVGPLGRREKHRLLSEAQCLLVPSLVSETSSLVAMEALAAGTPVIAFRRGALPEIVEHGQTGFLVNDEEEMAEAIRWTEWIDRRVCWERARERFSLEKMLHHYFEFYGKVLDRTRAEGAGCPHPMVSTGATAV
jgi:glycosyltransferase involved in cell wall biosynthesis